jgi:hypothetical protein
MMQQLSESTSVLPKLGKQSIPRPRPPLRLLSRAPSLPPAPLAPSAASPMPALARLYTAPFGFVLHPVVNQHARCVPLVLEHAADLASVRRALELVAAEGGFDAQIRHVWQVEARIRLRGARAASEAAARLRERSHELLELATRAIEPRARGFAPLAIEVVQASAEEVRLRLQLEASQDDGLDALDALEAAMHGAARAMAPLLIRVAGVRPSVRVGHEATERASVSCRIGSERLLASALSLAGLDGRPSAEHAVARATAALATGARSAAIAAAHNALIEHAVAAVALALGNAPARVTRGLEQHARRAGGCAPLCNWRLRGDAVEGAIELPIELATHGRWPALDGEPCPTLDAARDITLLAACIGMAASLIALEDAVRARATEQRRSLPPPPPRRRPRATPERAARAAQQAAAG